MARDDIEISINLDGLLEPVKKWMTEIWAAADEVARLVQEVAEKATGVDRESAELVRATEQLLLAIKGPDDSDDSAAGSGA